MNDDVDKGRKRQEKLAKDAERKRKQRMSYSEEKRDSDDDDSDASHPDMSAHNFIDLL